MGKAGFRILISVHILGVLLLSLGLWLFGYEKTPSFVFGGVATAINFYTLALVLKAIAGKKSVAWAMLLVVFKYAIFGYFIYYLVERKSLDLLAFALGIGSLSITAPLAGWLILKTLEEKMAHFNWLQLIGSVGHHYIHIATAILVTILLIGFAFLAKIKLGDAQKNFAPADKFSIRGVAELFTEVIVNLSDMVLGPGHRNYVPLFGAMFLYILGNNLMGMVPGMTPATDNVNTTVAVAIFSFLAYNYYGLKEGGLTYLKHFLGPVIWLAWLMLPLEIVSHLVRPMSLGLRLMGNMQGDHTVIGIFLELAPWGVPMIFYGMGLLVSVIQAFVFTLLSMVYLSMAIAHEEH